jgi:hypothetical protein
MSDYLHMIYWVLWRLRLGRIFTECTFLGPRWVLSGLYYNTRLFDYEYSPGKSSCNGQSWMTRFTNWSLDRQWSMKTLLSTSVSNKWGTKRTTPTLVCHANVTRKIRVRCSSCSPRNHASWGTYRALRATRAMVPNLVESRRYNPMTQNQESCVQNPASRILRPESRVLSPGSNSLYWFCCDGSHTSVAEQNNANCWNHPSSSLPNCPRRQVGMSVIILLAFWSLFDSNRSGIHIPTARKKCSI